MAYNANDINYQLAIEEAARRNDLAAAARLEQERNQKISTMSAEDIARWNVSTTNNYSQWLNQGGSTEGSARDVVTQSDPQYAAKDQMNYNSYLWYGADEATRAALHAENQGLAASIGPGVTFDPTEGRWSGGGGGSTASTGSSWPTWDYSGLGDKPTFNSKYEQNIDELLNQILNREDFEYNLLEDDLYQQYKAQYNREGDRSMNDTLAAAASSAGGMNSYAINAAQQANDYYAAQLTDKIPELYQLAYEMYLNDIDMQVRDLGLLTDMDDTQYGRYRDTMSDWYNDRDFSYNMYRDDVSDHKWQLDFDRAGAIDERDFNYGVYRDTVGDSQWRQQFDTSNSQWQQQFDQDNSRYTSDTAYDRAMERLTIGVMPDSALLSQAGISYNEAKAILDKVNGVVDPASESDIVSGTGMIDVLNNQPVRDTKPTATSYDNGGLSTAQIKELQNYYGVAADGKWGDNSKSAANGLSAQKAWDAYQAAAGSGSTEVANSHSESWVHVQGYGRLTWQELEQLVDKGKIIEEKTSYGLKYSKAD